jgi:hypothetical protein
LPLETMSSSSESERSPSHTHSYIQTRTLGIGNKLLKENRTVRQAMTTYWSNIEKWELRGKYDKYSEIAPMVP